MQKVFVVSDIGKIQITKKQGVKTIRLTVHPITGVRISIPWYVSYEEGLSFLQQKKNWVQKKQEEQNLHQSSQQLFIDDGFEFLSYKIDIKYQNSNKVSAQIINNSINVSLPLETDPKSAVVQKFIQKVCEKALKKEAFMHLPDRVDYIARKHLFRYKSVRIGHSRTRWGSCRFDNNLTFSCYLMLMPSDLIDFVILHELCHTVYKNHSKQFHKLVNDVCSGNEAVLNKRLKLTKHPFFYHN